MQIVTINKDRKVNPNQIFVGNQYENQIETIKFNLPEYDGYRYLVVNKNSESYAIPLDKEGVFYVDSLLTWRSGIYECNIVISGKELNESSEIVGTELTFISNTIRLKVVSNSINASQLSKAPLPINLQIVYDDLLNLYEKVKKDYEDGSFNGKDGYSPTIEVLSTETGNKVIITDKNGKKEFTVENGEDGKSAYELAVENGFEGTEEEWLESLRYDHSDEFKQLADQVKQDAQSSADNATKAENAMNEANKTAQENVKAINEASTTAQKEITASKGNAVQAVQSAQQTAENAIGTKQTEAVQAVDTAKTSATQTISEQKESVVSAITQERSEAVEAIETGKTEALNDIATDKTGALNDIATAKDNAIEEIENTGVPLEDIEKLAIKETTQGNPVIISDSSDWRLQKFNIYGQSEQNSTTGKNLLNPTGAIKDGWNIDLPNFKLEVGKQYTYAAPILESSKTCGLYAKASDTKLVPYLQSRKTQTFTVPQEADFSQGLLLGGGSADSLTLGDELTAMVESGSVATSFEPYTGGKPSPSTDYPQEIISKEISEIKVTGLNLCKSTFILENSRPFASVLYCELDLKKNVTYYFSFIGAKGNELYNNENIFTEYKRFSCTGEKEIVAMTVTEDLSKDNMLQYENGKGWIIFKNTGINTVIPNFKDVQVSLVNVEEYEPYKEQVVNLTSPITLRGIPVSSGGNVMIDGQQYISDVICEKNGVIGVERNVKQLLFDGSEDEAVSVGEYLGNVTRTTIMIENSSYNVTFSDKFKFINNYDLDEPHFYYWANVLYLFVPVQLTTSQEFREWLQTNPVDVVYTLETPTFEPLSEEVQAQYKALKSYYPNTVIDTGCWNEVTFIADTKTWIENKINGVTELALGIGGK